MAPPNRGPRLELNKYKTWEIRWSVDRRSMRQSTNETEREKAELKLATFLQQRVARKIGATLTVEQAVNDYLREHVDNGNVVDKERQHFIGNNLVPFFGKRDCRDLTPTDVFQYLDGRRQGKIGARTARSNGTLRRELNMLIAAMNHAVRARRLPATDRPYIPLPSPPGAKDLWLTEDEARQLLAAAGEEGCRGALFIQIALGTAARRRSIETLTWSQVDLTARRIQYNPPGRRQTAKRRVALPISDALLPQLEAAYAARTTDLVLGSDRAITKRLEAVCRRAYKATGNRRFLVVTPHTLRHTWATLAARAGVPIYEIAGVLGDSIATVTKNYLHHSPEHLRSAVNFLSENGTVAAVQQSTPSATCAPSRAQRQEKSAPAPDTDQHEPAKPLVVSW